MGGSMNNVYCVLGVAFVLANVCIWSSFAEDDTKRVKYEYEVEKGKVPHIVTARRTPDDYPIVFIPDYDHTDIPVNKAEPKHENQSQTIPLELIQRLNNIENFTELQSLLHNFQFDLGNRFGDDEADNVDRKGAVMPKPATCNPELVTVPLRNTTDKSVFFYPSCTRVERCGGCCHHELLSCQPTATELINYQVIVTRYEGGGTLAYKGKEIVTIEQHLKCKCDCKVKESDCNSLQDYNHSECRCVCLNVDEEQKCLQENDTKLWDPSDCTCGCREVKECSTGLFFDHKTCSCVQVPITRRRAPYDPDMQFRRRETERNSYIYVPRPVVPLNKN